jgi:hypothetical protein
MGSNPINLALKFILELAALAAMGFWCWQLTSGSLRFVLAIGIPLAAAAVWMVSAVPDDPSRGGAALFKTPGAVRLVLELAFFAIAIWALYTMSYAKLALLMSIAVIVHYALSYDRIGWLLTR